MADFNIGSWQALYVWTNLDCEHLQQNIFTQSTSNTSLIRQFATARWGVCGELFGSFQCVIWTKQLNQCASLWCSLWGLLANGGYNGRAAEPGGSVLCVMVMLCVCFWAKGECVWNKKVLRIVTHKTIKNMTRNNYKTSCFLPWHPPIDHCSTDQNLRSMAVLSDCISIVRGITKRKSICYLKNLGL